MKKIHTVIIVIAVLALGAVLIYKTYTPSSVIPAEAGIQGSDLLDSGSGAGMTSNDAANAKADIAAIQSVPAAARYTNAKYGFSFEKPEGYTVGTLHDAIGDTFLVQPAGNTSDKSDTTDKTYSGFQIYITPIDAPMTLTPNLIKSDLPGTSVNSPLAITLGGAKGIMFASNNAAFGGASYEIWFTKSVIPAEAGIQGYLYQITSYASFASELQKIIGTWKFN